jgi:MYXO-CTERM domain-containing protein
MAAERFALSLLVAASALFAGPSAWAFCRTTTGPMQVGNAGDCVPDGRPLFWRSQCVGYRMHTGGSRQLAFTDARILMTRAFRDWQSAASICAPSINVVELSPTGDATVGYGLEGPNENVVVFRDDEWVYETSSLEMTTLTFRVDSGEILDADIEINTRDAVYLPVVLDGGIDGGSPGGEDALDMGVMLTHAAGHFLGISHSTVTGSVMIPYTDPGPRPRPLLGADDGAAICAAYPEGGGRTTLDDQGNPVTIEATPCALAGVQDGTCGPLDVSHGCSFGGRPAPRQWPAVLGLVGLALLLAGRRSARCG